MTRNKRTNQQQLRSKKFKSVYCWVDQTTSTKGSHTKHGAWTYAKPLQMLGRWVKPFNIVVRDHYIRTGLRGNYMRLVTKQYRGYMRWITMFG